MFTKRYAWPSYLRPRTRAPDTRLEVRHLRLQRFDELKHVLVRNQECLGHFHDATDGDPAWIVLVEVDRQTIGGVMDQRPPLRFARKFGLWAPRARARGGRNC